jgi:hypothetical protein
MISDLTSITSSIIDYKYGLSFSFIGKIVVLCLTDNRRYEVGCNDKMWYCDAHTDGGYIEWTTISCISLRGISDRTLANITIFTEANITLAQ